MTPPTMPLEVIGTPLAFHGGPEEHRRQKRTLHVDDIERVDAHAAHSRHGWHPVCTLALFGGEDITIVLDASPDHAQAHQLAVELAAAYRLYLPDEDETDFDPRRPPDDAAAPHLFYDCAVCASLNTRTVVPGGTAP